jgi:hypothetical protein
MTASAEETARTGVVLRPAPDVAVAAGRSGCAFGLATRSTDSEPYAALDGKAARALSGPAQDAAEGPAAESIKMLDGQATAEAAVLVGGLVARSPRPWEHELLAVVLEARDNALVVYGPS